MNNCGKVCKGYNEGSEWIFQQSQEIKETSVDFTINKMLQVCFGNVGVFKSSDVVGTETRCGSAENMVLNPNLDGLSATYGE